MYVTSCDIKLGKLTDYEWAWLHSAATTIASAPWEEDDVSFNSKGVCLNSAGKPMFEKGQMAKICSELPGIFEDGETNFGFKLDRDGEGFASFGAEVEGPNIDAVATLLDIFMKLYRPKEHLGFSWGWMEGGDGGGGAVFISGRSKVKPEIISTAHWLEEREKSHKKRKR